MMNSKCVLQTKSGRYLDAQGSLTSNLCNAEIRNVSDLDSFALSVANINVVPVDVVERSIVVVQRTMSDEERKQDERNRQYQRDRRQLQKLCRLIQDCNGYNSIVNEPDNDFKMVAAALFDVARKMI